MYNVYNRIYIYIYVTCIESFSRHKVKRRSASVCILVFVASSCEKELTDIQIRQSVLLRSQDQGVREDLHVYIIIKYLCKSIFC